jgi:ferredoxin
MIVATQKPIDEVRGYLTDHGHKNILVLGCETCVSVCNAGGQREVATLASLLRLSGDFENVAEQTLERQCDVEFFDAGEDLPGPADAIVSTACGVGVQLAARRFENLPVYPALNTQMMGINEGAGLWSEACLGCGDCKLGIFGGVCPVSQCSKSLCNGPCGGSADGMCEVDTDDIECGWAKIIDRLTALDQLDILTAAQDPRDWSKMHDGRPRKLTREDIAVLDE